MLDSLNRHSLYTTCAQFHGFVVLKKRSTRRRQCSASTSQLECPRFKNLAGRRQLGFPHDSLPVRLGPVLSLNQSPRQHTPNDIALVAEGTSRMLATETGTRRLAAHVRPRPPASAKRCLILLVGHQRKPLVLAAIFAKGASSACGNSGIRLACTTGVVHPLACGRKRRASTPLLT